MEIEIIYGPPGTGKTFELQRILAKEVHDTPLNKIAYVSYTKEGAEQGKQRASESLGVSVGDLPYFRTLHSIAFRELNMKRGQVISKQDYKRFSEHMGMKFTGYYTEEFNHNDDRYLFFDILHRNNEKTAQNYVFDLDMDKLAFVRKNYRAYKKHFHISDYTDMIEDFNAKNNALPVEVAFIDEAQDLTTLQWKMIWTAFRNCKRIYIAGDDDQAIYEWSGADVEYFLNIDGKPRTLAHSYRLPKNILRYATTISSLIGERIEKEYTGTKEKGILESISDFRELDISSGQWMFLCRNNWFLMEIIEYIRSLGLVYKYRKELSVKPFEVDMIKLYEHYRQGKQKPDWERLRLHLKPQANLTAPWYDSFVWKDEKIMYYRDLIAHKTPLDVCRITVSTIHAVKGAEADNVVLLEDITKRVAENIDHNPDAEHRVFYVGATRAKHNLYIVDSKSRYTYPLRNKIFL